ncbi:unnamed protein product [Enterobius vermicularis]|uniref:Activin_recp domain-containing protein n=1 Tax=Enterobius vermicularis TaxID=51028 RepID=A0A0N4VHL4_ENTVE|nr:unnamed protein product [Enterobius vermicularis]
MFVVRCIVVTVLLFTSATLALKCRTGRQLVLYGNNNQGDFDKPIGPGCRFDQNSSTEVCCCTDNNCNGVGAVKASLLISVMIVLLVCIY